MYIRSLQRTQQSRQKTTTQWNNIADVEDGLTPGGSCANID